MGSAGKSSSIRSPSKAARSGPLRVWKVRGMLPSTAPPARSAWAEAKVAWPHRSISVAGENQRRPKVVGSSVGVRNAVSAMPSSKAMDCMRVVVERIAQEAHGRGVAAEGDVAERVDPGDRDAHGHHDAKRPSASRRTASRLQKAQRTSVRPASGSAGS